MTFPPSFVPIRALPRHRPAGCLYFVCVFQAFRKRVFKGQKICLTYFELCQTYFKLSQRYFLFAPMWGKRAETQFSFSRHGKQTFKATHFPCRNSVLRQTIYINKINSNETSLTKRGYILYMQAYNQLQI